METVQDTLREIASLLARYGYDERATFVHSLAEDPDQSNFWTTLAGLEFWGGSGAVWEVEPFHMSHPDAVDAPRDYRQFQRLMIELSDELEQRGLARMSRRNADLFRRELGLNP